MRLNSNFLALLALAILALAVDHTAEAFVKGTITTRVRPASTFELSAVAKKKVKTTKKKAATKSKAAAKKATSESFRKPDFIASVAGKLDCTKLEADAAMVAVLETITEVSTIY
jgi:menaquinone-dependent protoporphyrinogen IX oxidase